MTGHTSDDGATRGVPTVLIIAGCIGVAVLSLLFLASRIRIYPEVKPELPLRNDTDSPVVVQRLDGGGTVSRRLEVREDFTAEEGDAFLGRTLGCLGAVSRGDREDEDRGDVVIGVFQVGGQPRGRLVIAPEFFLGCGSTWVCLSAAAEPPPVVKSLTDARNTCRPPQPTATTP